MNKPLTTKRLHAAGLVGWTVDEYGALVFEDDNSISYYGSGTPTYQSITHLVNELEKYKKGGVTIDGEWREIVLRNTCPECGANHNMRQTIHPSEQQGCAWRFYDAMLHHDGTCVARRFWLAPPKSKTPVCSTCGDTGLIPLFAADLPCPEGCSASRKYTPDYWKAVDAARATQAKEEQGK